MHASAFRKAGYKLLVRMIEPIPRSVKMKNRPGLWNWKMQLK